LIHSKLQHLDYKNRDTSHFPKKVMESIEKKITLLRDYFLKQRDISMAFIFGSYARGGEISESDFDLAVYFKPEGELLEWEEIRFYSGEDRIWSDVERIVGVKTDLVILNRAPSTLAFSIIQEGRPIIIKDYSIYLRFFLTISSTAEDFREYVSDFWRIKQRSGSLSEIDKERLIRIVDFLETEMKDYPEFADIAQREYEVVSSLRRNVERWVENIVNASIDIAKIILASEKKRLPQTYREVLQELSLIEGFDSETAEQLAQFAKLKNILAHEYLDIRFRQIKRFIEKSEPAYSRLLAFVKDFLTKK